MPKKVKIASTMGERLRAGIDYPGVATPFYCNDGSGNFLLHKRSGRARDEKGKWDFGSGELKRGQRLEESVLREVMEEWGVIGIIQEQLPAHDILRIMNKRQTHWVVVPFFIKVDVKRASIMESKKFSDMGVFRLDDLPKPLHSGVQTTMDRYLEFFAKYR